MHEINIVRQVVKTVEEFAAENNVGDIREIVLDIGELSLVIPEYVEDIYPAVVKGTVLEDTKLIINVVPGLAECDDCGEIFNVIEANGICPNCGSDSKEVLSGKDFYIKEIHIPE
ncbi:MAG: hydrogenase maturation nickel metallochaperone HypA [Oscillospiraceae bacterium]|nr:hydrogenase maturation nickel metallochaperone HypA [Oscillospiraceae bacterium]